MSIYIHVIPVQSPLPVHTPKLEMAATIVAEDQDLGLFHPSPCALYYVQSPSAASHTLSHPSESTALILSPFPLRHDADADADTEAAAFTGRHSRTDDGHEEEASRLTLSRYSSSRGSNNSFLHDKKASGRAGRRQVLRVVSGRPGDEDGDDDGDGTGGRSGMWRFVSLDPEASCCCIVSQVVWRVVVSVAFALLVFFLATKPRPPKISFKIGKIEQFSLGEGLDNSGVATNFLNCNCSVSMEIDNYSKVFNLHIHPPLLEMSFGHFKFASSQGEESNVEAQTSSTLRLFVATQNKPMYAAGRSMQDLLESSQGLPVRIQIRARLGYRVVWNLISLRYHHHSECLVILRRAYRNTLADNNSKFSCITF